MSADVVVLPVVRIERDPPPPTRESSEAHRVARLGLMARAATGLTVSMTRVELWFASEDQAQEFFDLAKEHAS